MTAARCVQAYENATDRHKDKPAINSGQQSLESMLGSACFSEQILSADKYLSMFLCHMEAIVYAVISLVYK